MDREAPCVFFSSSFLLGAGSTAERNLKRTSTSTHHHNRTHGEERQQKSCVYLGESCVARQCESLCLLRKRDSASKGKPLNELKSGDCDRPSERPASRAGSTTFAFFFFETLQRLPRSPPVVPLSSFHLFVHGNSSSLLFFSLLFSSFSLSFSFLSRLLLLSLFLTLFLSLWNQGGLRALPETQKHTKAER